MLIVLKKALNFEEEFVYLFNQYLKNISNSDCKINISDEFLFLLVHHPDPIQCFQLLPPKWLNNKEIREAVVQIFNRFMLDISSLEHFRNIQIQERLRALEERVQPGKRFDFKDEHCSICSMEINQQEGGISGVFWVRPMIIAFPTCNHVYHISCIESTKKHNASLFCMKCTQK